MPIYDYLCTACGHRADILHGIDAEGPHFCPSCGREGTMRKQFALPTIHYKGSGWAKKDRGGSGAGRRAATAGGSDEGKGETMGSGEPSTSSRDGGGASSGESSTSPKGKGGSSTGESHAAGPD